MKTPTQLRIVKRDGLFVVQIIRQGFLTKCVFEACSQEKADEFCSKYISEERVNNDQGVEVMTYNNKLGYR